MNMQLEKWHKMKSAVAECHSVDEITLIRNKAEAYRYALKQAKESPEVIRKAEEIKLRAERRAGELLKETPKARGAAEKDWNKTQSHDVTTLDDMGITKNQSSKWQKIASIPEEKFENYIAIEKELSTSGVLRISKNVHVSNNSGENEWYTPPFIIEAAKSVMGNIDLDPASSKLANETVGAKEFYTIEDDGIKKDWHGRVWLNPPYSQPDISNFAKAVTSKKYDEIMILVNNATETDWFRMMAEASKVICFINKRLKFIDRDGNPSGAPLQGQAIIYKGSNIDSFIKKFKENGLCMIPA